VCVCVNYTPVAREECFTHLLLFGLVDDDDGGGGGGGDEKCCISLRRIVSRVFVQPGVSVYAMAVPVPRKSCFPLSLKRETSKWRTRGAPCIVKSPICCEEEGRRHFQSVRLLAFVPPSFFP